MRRHLPALAAFALLCLACAGLKPGGKEPEVPAQPKEYTREEFEKAVLGKKVADVTKLLGKPASTEGKPFRDKEPPEGRPDHPRFEGTMYFDRRHVRLVGLWADTFHGVRVVFKAGVAERVEW